MNNYYVYLHRRKDNNEVFYVGKGKGSRARVKANRNRWWNSIVSKHGFVVEYVEVGLSEQTAFELEVETIKFYRDNNHNLCNLTDGGEGCSGSTRKIAITDGFVLDLNMAVSPSVSNITRHWKQDTTAINIIIMNLLKRCKIHYSRCTSTRQPKEVNRKGVSNHTYIKAINYLMSIGYLTATISKATDSIKAYSYMEATDMLYEKFVGYAKWDK